MSEYLGTKSHASKASECDRPKGKSTLDWGMLPGGPVTDSFENYIKSIYKPGTKLPSAEAVPISASAMLRMQDHLGSAALDESFDAALLQSPLESTYSGLGLTGLQDTSYKHFPVYAPKQSNEYFSSKYGTRPYLSNSCGYQGVYSSYKERSDEEWKRDNKQLIIGRDNNSTTPLTPYMYQDHPYVRRQDSRIVGSNFVQITSRPRDRFLDKIDKTLAEARAIPRF